MEKAPVIEKGIPMPDRKGAMQSMAATLRKMDIGDSIVVDARHYANVRVNAGRLGLKMAFRKIDSQSHRGWRIA